MGQGLDLQGPRGSRGKPKRSQGVKWWANSYRVPGGQGVGLQGPRGLKVGPTGSAQRVGFFNIGSGRVLDKIPGSGSGSGRVGVSKYTIGYFRVSFYFRVFPGISGISRYFRVCRVFSGISGFTHTY